jgi:hypothetical protein
VLEVGVLEKGRVFETVAEETVEGDVGRPDEGQFGGEMPVLNVTGEEEGQREGQGVDEVVGRGAEAWVDEVGEHEEVGGEEEDCEEEPTVVEVLVGEDGEGEEEGFFDVQEDGGAGEHDLVIRDWLGTVFCGKFADGKSRVVTTGEGRCRSFDCAALRSG